LPSCCRHCWLRHKVRASSFMLAAYAGEVEGVK
jgi:hypothetical protein